MKVISKSLRKCGRSFGHAWQGIRYAIYNENNFIYHIMAIVIILLMGLFLNFTSAEWIVIIALIGFVISCELLNTALEKTVDIISPQHNRLAGIIKDVAAGAVLIASITALIIALIIILNHLNNL